MTNTPHTPSLKGYALAIALRNEGNEVQREDRAELFRRAAFEIESLVKETRTLLTKRNQLHEALRASIAGYAPDNQPLPLHEYIQAALNNS